MPQNHECVPFKRDEGGDAHRISNTRVIEDLHKRQGEKLWCVEEMLLFWGGGGGLT